MATKLTKISDWYAGNKRLLIFDVTDKDHGSMPLDLTGRTLKWAISRSKDGSYQKERVLEKKTGGAGIVTSLTKVATAVVNAGGSGYSVGDKLLINGGTGDAAYVTVATLGGGGAVATVTVTAPGTYSVNPSATGAATTCTTSPAASGCTLNLTFSSFAGRALVTVPSADTVDLLGDYHQELEVVDGTNEAEVVAVGDVTFLSNVENS